MSNFQLYKQRKFNDFLNDTTLFFRQFGGDYFKNFFLINGGIILLVCFLLYFVMKYFLLKSPLEQLGQDVYAGAGGSLVTTVVLCLLILVVGLAYSIFSFGLPNAYFDHLADNGAGGKQSSSDILKAIWDIAGDVLVFLVISLFTFLPIYIVLAIISKLLMALYVGYFILIAGTCFLLTWLHLSLIVYLKDYYAGYLESLGIAWNMIIRNFKHIIGANAVLFVILYILHSIVTFVPSFIISLFYFTSGKSSFTDFPSLLNLIYILVIISTSVLSNVMFVQQFLIYYSSVEKEENIQAISDLDSIGKHED